MNTESAKQALDNIITKARVHLYKPIQIAEILHRDRIDADIDIASVETYRTLSRRWRDVVCLQFLGRTSTSSARYQDDLFNDNAIPPSVLTVLGEENRAKNGIVEAYIYRRFAERLTQMSDALEYCVAHDKSIFHLNDFLSLFWNEAGLRRSIDKVYEIVVYALFSALVREMELTVQVSIHPDKHEVLREFADFASNVIGISAKVPFFQTSAKMYRVGVTNASDRGLDMWANFGLAVQIKHLSLNESLAEEIVHSVTADRIVIVCKQAEASIIRSLVNQLGWKSRIQGIITETDLVAWYEKALRGRFGKSLGDTMLTILANEIKVEFPITENTEFRAFCRKRRYDKLFDERWQ
jgi:hypothetical protein